MCGIRGVGIFFEYLGIGDRRDENRERIAGSWVQREGVGYTHCYRLTK
jgi:hypothetical protein